MREPVSGKMNCTETVRSAVDIIRLVVFDRIQFFYDLFRWTWRLARFGLQAIVVLPSTLFFDVCETLLHLILTLACIWITVIVISFIKSLKPRYNYHSDTSKSATNSNTNGNEKPDSKIHRPNEIFSPSSIRSMRASCDRSIAGYLNARFPLAGKLWSRIKTESNHVNQICSPALSVDDVEAVYKRLSWSYTQVDIESVNWLNQTLRTFWPNVKSLLNIFIFNDLLKPKKAGNKMLAAESQKLSRQKPKLSVYLSSRRKLALIEQIEADSFNRRSPHNLLDRRLFFAIIYLLKLVIVYMKQFFIDYVSYLFKRGKRTLNTGRGKKFEINLEKFLSAEKKAKSYHATRSWAGFESPTGNGFRKDKVRLSRERKTKSEPSYRTKMLTRGLLGARGMIKLRDRRLKLAERFRKAYEMTKDNNELLFELIRLGESIPMINGLKYIEERNDLMIDPVRTSRHLVGSDERNMRFTSELSYASDEKFQIRLNLPRILGRIRLVDFKAQIRCYLTLNHTISELNRDLKIFDTPDEVLFPSINYIQLSLVDVPSFDWKLDRPTRRRMVDTGNDKQRLSGFGRLSNYIRTLVDPVDIINHPYFKYTVHTIIYVALKWFQPFDIRIGPHLYLKTIC